MEYTYLGSYKIESFLTLLFYETKLRSFPVVVSFLKNEDYYDGYLERLDLLPYAFTLKDIGEEDYMYTYLGGGYQINDTKNLVMTSMLEVEVKKIDSMSFYAARVPRLKKLLKENKGS